MFSVATSTWQRIVMTWHLSWHPSGSQVVRTRSSSQSPSSLSSHLQPFHYFTLSRFGVCIFIVHSFFCLHWLLKLDFSSKDSFVCEFGKLPKMADVEGAKNRAHEDAENILKSADKKADEALSGSTYEQVPKGDADKAPTMGDKASGATEKAKESTGSTWESTKQGTSNAAGTAKDKTGSAWESTKEGTADAAEKTKETTGNAWKSTKQGTSDAAEATKEKAVQAKDESASLLQTAGEKVKEAASATYDALDKANRYPSKE